MIFFHSIEDLEQLNTDHPAYHTIQQCLERTGHLEGYLVLLEPGDTYIDLPELKGDLDEIPWEGVSEIDGYEYYVYLTNNEFAIEVLRRMKTRHHTSI